MPERGRLPPVGRWCGLAAGLLALAAAAAEPAVLQASASEPRAFGYQVGDVVTREVRVEVPAGLVLDESSLPRPGARGQAVELRSLGRRGGAGRLELTLAYQVFLSPVQPRTLEMPALHLRFRGQPRDQEVLVEAWPLTVAPLVPEEVSSRRGLGELQPDAAPPLMDTHAGRWRLLAYGVLALVLLAYLAQVYFGLPWWRRRQRPFAQAWRALRPLDVADVDESRWRAAYQRLHEALNLSHGEVLFAHALPRFVQARPRFAPLQDELARFFAQSRQLFFGDQAPAADERRWLLDLCRRCRDAERGTP